MIGDTSVILRAFFPGEAQEQAQAVVNEHIAGPISHAQADETLQAKAGLG